MGTRENILNATIQVFNKKGLKFTMDDIASELSMSKKTIYTIFRDKEALCLEMVDYCFDHIKEAEKEVLADTGLNTVDKLRKLLGVMPEGYREIDFRQLYSLKDKYPNIYARIELRLETGWEATIDLIHKGMEEGVLRRINPLIVKTMMEATIEQFLQRNILITNGISYNDALQQAVSILVDGMTNKQQEGETK